MYNEKSARVAGVLQLLDDLERSELEEELEKQIEEAGAEGGGRGRAGGGR